MRRVALYLPFLIVGMLLIPPGSVEGQGTNAEVSALLTEVRLDSLTRYVSELSGEAPIYVADSTLILELDSTNAIDSLWVFDAYVRLPNREAGANDAATAYLERRLRSFGYDSVVVDAYPSDNRYPATKNVLAFKPGADSKGPVWLIGAHYDSVIMAPGADDNASGTAVVLECARVLADVDLTASVIFGFWDTEEAGLIGSNLFAARAYDEEMRIDGVLNLDMVGWDGDQDRTVEIHADSLSLWLGEYIDSVSRSYQLELAPNLYEPGVGRSDHVSFRAWGFPAVLIIEEYRGGDFNPYYHSADDKIEHFNIPFFHEVAKLAVATVGQLALSGTAVAVEIDPSVADDLALDPVYPNPARDFVELRHRATRPDDVRFWITDVLGRTVAVLRDDLGNPASRRVRWTIPPELAEGIYFVTCVSGGATETRSFVIAR